jgi:hypothetical protein
MECVLLLLSGLGHKSVVLPAAIHNVLHHYSYSPLLGRIDVLALALSAPVGAATCTGHGGVCCNTTIAA